MMFQRRDTHFRVAESNTESGPSLDSGAGNRGKSKFANCDHQLLRLTAAGSNSIDCLRSRQQQQHQQRQLNSKQARDFSCRINSGSNNNNKPSILLKETLRRIVIAIATIRLTSTTTSTSTAATVTTSTTSASFIGALFKLLSIGFYYILAFISLLMLILYINRSLHTNANQHHQAGLVLVKNNIERLSSVHSSVDIKEKLPNMLLETNGDEHAGVKSIIIFQDFNHINNQNSNHQHSNVSRNKRSLDSKTLVSRDGNDNNNTSQTQPLGKREQHQSASEISSTKTLARKPQNFSKINNMNRSNSNSGTSNTTHDIGGGSSTTNISVVLIDSNQNVSSQKESDTPQFVPSVSSTTFAQNHHHQRHQHHSTSLSSKSINIKTNPTQINHLTPTGSSHNKHTAPELLSAKNNPPTAVPLLELAAHSSHAISALSLNNGGMLSNHSAMKPSVIKKPTVLELEALPSEVQWIPILKPLELIGNIRTQVAQELRPATLIISNPILNHRRYHDHHPKPTHLNNPPQIPQLLYSNPQINNNNKIQTSRKLATVPLLASSTQTPNLLPQPSYRTATGVENLRPPIHMNNQHAMHHFQQPPHQVHQHTHLHEHHHLHLNHNHPMRHAPPETHSISGDSYRQASNHQWRQPRLNSHHDIHTANSLPRYTKMYKRILLCDKTLVSLDYVRNPHSPPPIGPHIPFEHPISQPHYDIDSDIDGDNVIDLDTNIDPVLLDRRSSTHGNISSSSTNNVSTSTLTSSTKPPEERADESVLLIDKRSYLADDDPLVKCDMWDLEKGLKNRKPPKEILQMAIKADFDTVRDAINRCRQVSEKTLPPDDDAFRDGLEIMSTEDLISLFSMKRGLIPGTKWCGLGDQASSYNDLGPKHRIDICCRAHDHCPIRLKPFRNDYGVLNIALYTKSHCDCDADFYRCLREAHSRTADMLGNLYFNVMKLQCMREERMKICREMKPIALGFERCVRYEESPVKTVFRFTTPPVAY